MSDHEAIRADERERLSARVYENGWCPTCGTKTADPGVIPGPDRGACPRCGGWRKAGMIHRCPAATPDPPRTVLDPETGIEEPVTTGRIPDAEFVEPPLMPPAASPDERLREAGERLAQAVARVCGEGHPALGMWRVALGTDSRGKPDGASVPDQSCAACGGSGDRNGNRRAADPFGTCPGCGGTGNVAAADREAPDEEEVR